MKTKLGGIVIGLLVSFTALAGPTRDYDETTTVAGKVPVDLRGVWLLVAQPEVAKGKFKTFPELLMISQQKDGRPSFHLLDVRLPADMTGELKAANDNLEFWAPSDAELAALRRGWSKLRPATEKDVLAGDHAYARIDFRLAAPERYAEVFPRQDKLTKGVLSESTFSLSVTEQYRALPLPRNSNVTQLAGRTSVYGFRTASDHVLEGAQVTGFLASLPYAPLPLTWSGKFTMYCLASCGRGTGAPTKTTKPPSPAQGRRRK
jgi:hypothetical protein